MKSMKSIAAGLCAALVLMGCGASNTLKGTGIGAVAGAGLGALVGKIAGNTAVGAAVGGAVGAGAGALIGKHMDKVKAQAEAELANATVQSVTDANGLQAVKVTFDSGILFQTNKSDLNTTSKGELNKFANVLKNNTDCSVAIIGHTDSTGSDAVNNPLSQKRAQSVSNYLQTCGVSTGQIKSVEGLGSTSPIADNSTAAGRQQNRRVEVFMYASEAMINAANNGTLQ